MKNGSRSSLPRLYGPLQMEHVWGRRRGKLGRDRELAPHLEEFGKLSSVLFCQMGCHALQFVTGSQVHSPLDTILVAALMPAFTGTLKPLEELSDSGIGDGGLSFEHRYFLF